MNKNLKTIDSKDMKNGLADCHKIIDLKDTNNIDAKFYSMKMLSKIDFHWLKISNIDSKLEVIV